MAPEGQLPHSLQFPHKYRKIDGRVRKTAEEKIWKERRMGSCQKGITSSLK